MAFKLGSPYYEDLLQNHPFTDGNLQGDLLAIRPSSSGTETDSIWKK